MGRPSVADSYHYKTSSQVCQALGISFEQLVRRIDQGVLPSPTKLGSAGLRLFDEKWLRQARAIIESSSEKERTRRQANEEVHGSEDWS